jgi:hypothetical protein
VLHNKEPTKIGKDTQVIERLIIVTMLAGFASVASAAESK